MTVALGRLGMREFDLASDADLVFVLPDRDAAELPFWTRVAERTIELITAYTGHGVMFAVDTACVPMAGRARWCNWRRATGTTSPRPPRRGKVSPT